MKYIFLNSLNIIMILCYLFDIIHEIRLRNFCNNIYLNSSNGIYQNRNFKIRVIFSIIFIIAMSILTVMNFFMKAQTISGFYVPIFAMGIFTRTSTFVFADDCFVTYKKRKAYNYDDLEDIEISEMKKNGKFLKLTLYFKNYNINCTSILIDKEKLSEMSNFLKSKNIKINNNIKC